MPDLGVVRDARPLVAEVVAQERFSGFVAALPTSDVVTNAVLHARADFEVAVSIDDAGGHDSVKDRNSRRPPPLAPIEAQQARPQGGESYGVGVGTAEPTADGKVAWFELAVAS